MKPTIDKIKQIVGHFKRSNIASENFLKYQTTNGFSLPKRLIQDVATRWNSTYHMIQRFVDLEEAVRATVALLDRDLPIITNEEWQACKYVCEILKPFDEMTSSMSGENYLTGSSVMLITRCLKLVQKNIPQKQFYLS